MATARTYPPEWLDQVPAVVFAPLSSGEVRLLLLPSSGLADGGAPRDVPTELVPPSLRLPNTALWARLDEHMNILRVWRREP